MGETVRHYFASGNTAAGVHLLFGSAFQGLDQLYILRGCPGTGKSTIMQQVADEMLRKGRSVEMFHCPFDSDTLDGLILTEERIGIVDGNACRDTLGPESAKAVFYIDMDQAVDQAKVSRNQSNLAALQEGFEERCTKAYETFAKALRIHDEWEKYYIDSMNFTKANQVAEELVDFFFANRVKQKQSKIRHVFLGAATPKGAVDFVENLTAGVSKRIFVKGRPGSGKSTMLKKLVSVAEERGFDAEVFHCGFDPGSLDMVIFPEISVAIFDSTAPHEYFPSRESDEILDMYEQAIAAGTDEKYAKEMDGIKARYRSAMNEAISYLAEAKKRRDRLKGLYFETIDFSVIDRLSQQVKQGVEKAVLSSG
ncbi:PRK06851 family protein [Brevibacillus massiliensis]|jgi:hypothetical protein|uniref:PRK06851 family protein n=1 Tax=Brevibacillus massiliensis TaxID=1118054 RepID=UPI00030E9E15|nr:PRK06851 family protein [Brevibacillus massiliensis]